ncbi:MAG: hypothetical protein A2X56_06630 [Nitrospirae bacterium GWC2_57_13]|nr:MAG: hypothetical protein A2X56_06630 [Nitrospirae bacterium GWC2_57_13]OGW44914.1 MAG: hypothetical protein A2X57_00745 [Nitrospirae bacterium GWD2_57_8]
MLLQQEEKAKAEQREKGKYHTFWNRFWAGVIDGLIFLPLGLLFAWTKAHAHILPIIIVVPAVVSLSLIWVLYSIGMHGRFGQTIGKMLARVKVLDVSEQQLSMRQAVLRDSVPLVLILASIPFQIISVLNAQPLLASGNDSMPMKIISSVDTAWFMAEIITMLTNYKRRALHDFIARSVVVRC